MEKYGEAKFTTVFLSNNPQNTKKSPELIGWFRKLYQVGLAPEYGQGSSGNLSFRYKKGCIIKSTKTYFKTINPDGLVYVEDFDMKRKIAYVHGKLEPSTELQMHCLIYKYMKDINAVIHVHDYRAMRSASELRIPVTSVTSAGTQKIGFDVLKNLKISDYVIMKNHGIVAVGKTIKEAGNLVLGYHNKIPKSLDD